MDDLIEKICPSVAIHDCCDGNGSCGNCHDYLAKIIKEHDEKLIAAVINRALAELNPCATCNECANKNFFDKCKNDYCDLRWGEIRSKLERIKDNAE